MRALLDTHVLLWWVSGSPRLSRAQAEVLAAAGESESVWISDITLWEIATVHGLGRIELGLPLRDWLEKAAAAPLVQCLPITPAVAADLASLPPTFPRDPADRIIASSARVLGATLLTQDGHIIDSGAVPTLA